MGLAPPTGLILSAQVERALHYASLQYSTDLHYRGIVNFVGREIKGHQCLRVASRACGEARLPTGRVPQRDTRGEPGATRSHSARMSYRHGTWLVSRASHSPSAEAPSISFWLRLRSLRVVLDGSALLSALAPSAAI